MTIANDDTWARISYFVLLYPFTEQTNLYQVFDSNTWGGSSAAGNGSNGLIADVGNFADPPLPPLWWTRAKAEFPDFPRMIASTQTYRCPSRRGAGQSYHDAATSADLPGPLGDYAVPILQASSEYWNNCYRVGNPIDYQNHRGPLRPALPSTGTTITATNRGFSSRDDFSWWRDGASNQLLLGEKHIPNNRLGVSKNGRAGGTNPAFSADASYIIGARWGMPGCARNILSQAPTLSSAGDKALEADSINPVTGPTNSSGDRWDRGGGTASTANALNGGYDFGSAHPGVCNFAFGDGSVRGISNSTSKRTVLAHLVHVSDGQAVSLP
jgi:prepilin-type processing-associated H-X9-DG protein